MIINVLRVTQGYARTVYTRKQTDRRTALPVALEQARRLRAYLAWHSRVRGSIGTFMVKLLALVDDMLVDRQCVVHDRRLDEHLPVVRVE